MVNPKVRAKPKRNQPFCSECGERTVTKCEHCQQPLRGGRYELGGTIIPFDGGEVALHDYDEDMIDWGWVPEEPATFCYACGEPYPWTRRRVEAARQTIEELEELNKGEKENLKRSLPDLINQGPRSELAALRFKKALTKLGESGRALLMNILANIAAESVKRSVRL